MDATSSTPKPIDAFGGADSWTMPFSALALKLCGRTVNTSFEEIVQNVKAFIKRYTENPTHQQNITSSTISEIRKVIINQCPHLTIQMLDGQNLTIQNSTMKSSVVFVIDSSGSMSNYIMKFQENFKLWCIANKNKYDKMHFIFFGTYVHGPYTFDEVDWKKKYDGGSTCALNALNVLNNLLTTMKNTEVVFMTDGAFDDGLSIYDKVVGKMSANKLLMIFPDHTSQNVIDEHKAYLPRISEPNSVIATETFDRNSTNLRQMLDTQMSIVLNRVKNPLVTSICGKYLMLTKLTSPEIGTMLESLLKPAMPVNLVSQFFANLIGLYDEMLTNSGDLMNTLRSEEMRSMWTFMQPLKKRINEALLDPKNIHAASCELVRNFLNDFEKKVIRRKDDRIAYLNKQPQTNIITSEIKSINDAFKDMKRVDDYEVINQQIGELMQKHPSICVKYFSPLNKELNIDQIKTFPMTPINVVNELYGTISSLGVCSDKDPDHIRLVLDPKCEGLVLVMRLITYDARDEVKLTLGTVLVTRILFGFYVTQMLQNYNYHPSHQKIRLLIWQYVYNYSNSFVMSSITDPNEPLNTCPPSVKILHNLACHSNVSCSIVKNPYLWIEKNGRMVLNQKLIEDVIVENNILMIYNLIVSQKLSVNITTRHHIVIPFSDFVMIRGKNAQTWEQWGNTIVEYSHGIPVTKLMLLQESGLEQNATDFLKKYFDRGHRLILKDAEVRPKFNGPVFQQQLVDDWIITAFAKCKEPLNLQENTSALPYVSSEAERQQVIAYFENHYETNPLTYDTSTNVVIPTMAILNNLGRSNLDNFVLMTILNDPSFNKLPNPEKHERIKQLMSSYDPSLSVADTPYTYYPEMADQMNNLTQTINEKLIETIPVITVPVYQSQTQERAQVIDSFDLDKVFEAVHTNKLTADMFMCPIMHTTFDDPVLFGGHMYERIALMQWLSYDERKSSPLTRQTHDEFGVRLAITEPPREFIEALATFKQQC